MMLDADRAPGGLRRRLAVNLSWQTSSQIVGLLLGLAATKLLTRGLGPATFGKFTFLFAFIYFFQTFNDLGINTILIRDIAKAPERTGDLVRHVLGLKIVLAVLSTAAAWIIAETTLAGDLQQRRAVEVFALILPVQAMTLPIVTLQARLDMKRAAIIEIANRVTGFVLMVAALALGYSLLGVTLALVGGELVGLAGVLLLTRRLVVAIPAFDATRWRAVLTASAPLGAAGVLVAVVNRIDFMMLKMMLPVATRDMEIAYYGLAYRVTGLLERVPLLVMGTLFPVMSAMSVSDPERLRRLYRRGLKGFALLAVPVVALVTWLAPLAVRLLSGPSFGAAVPILRVLIWSTGCLYIALVAGNLLTAVGRQRAALWAWMIAAPVNVALNLYVIPRYGAFGAAFATALSFAIVLVAALILGERALADTLRAARATDGRAPDVVLRTP